MIKWNWEVFRLKNRDFFKLKLDERFGKFISDENYEGFAILWRILQLQLQTQYVDIDEDILRSLN